MICKGSITIFGADDKSGHIGYEANHETEDGEGRKNAAENNGQAPR
jgi:hypothetical protein